MMLRMLTVIALLGLATEAGAQRPFYDQLEAAKVVAARQPGLAIAERGVLDGVPYELLVPEKWNGGLVLEAHGYNFPERGAFNFDAYDSIQGLLVYLHGRGYATARSAFRVQGLNWQEGVEDTEALRRHVVERLAVKGPVILAGNHGGGKIGHYFLEKYPTAVDGCLCTNASLASLAEYTENLFAERLLFDYFFPGLPGSATAPSERQIELAEVTAALEKGGPAKLAHYLRMVKRRDAAAASASIRLGNSVLRDLVVTRLKGRNPFDNRNAVYFGSDDDAKLNREIPRHAADPEAAAYLKGWFATTGRIERPLLAINALGDQVTHLNARRRYLELVQQAGTEEHYVQLFMDVEGARVPHPVYVKGFEMLEAWIKTGAKPSPGEIRAD